MISELDCRILAKACGVCWHDYKIGDGFVSTCSCGRRGCIVREFCGSANPTFSVPDDWELVRVRVIIPNLREFRDSLFLYVTSVCRDTSSLEWWWTKTPEEKCQIAADFIKARPDLFPWVVDFLREREK
jgi:hypothetical protein